MRTSFGPRRRSDKTCIQRKVDVDMLNAVKSVLTNVSSVRPLSKQSTFYQQISSEVYTLYLS